MQARRSVPYALIALAACAPLPTLTPAQRAAGVATRAAWAEAKLPEPAGWRTKQCDVDRFYVEVVDDPAFTRRCGTTVTRAAGCSQWTSSNHFFRPWHWPLLTIAPRYASDQGLVVHELLHAYVECAQLGPSVWDPGDRQHADPRVWEAAGGASSVQGRVGEHLRSEAP